MNLLNRNRVMKKRVKVKTQATKCQVAHLSHRFHVIFKAQYRHLTYKLLKMINLRFQVGAAAKLLITLI